MPNQSSIPRDLIYERYVVEEPGQFGKISLAIASHIITDASFKSLLNIYSLSTQIWMVSGVPAPTL